MFFFFPSMLHVVSGFLQFMLCVCVRARVSERDSISRVLSP
jgi:hypothetical protein